MIKSELIEHIAARMTHLTEKQVPMASTEYLN